MNKFNFPSELRYDVISGDWVLIAKKRAERPEAFQIKKRAEIEISKKECPFCHIETQKKPVLILRKRKETKDIKNWTTVVIPNKYPALIPGEKIERKREGRFYQIISGIGYCELVITKDHKKDFAQLESRQIEEIVLAYKERYLTLSRKNFVKYISIFHNQGLEAGASQPHPHSQIITTPLIDVDLKKALSIAEKFFKKERRCLYCQLNEFEIRKRERVVFENKNFLALCPFASKTAFEIIISPRFHSPYFEEIKKDEIKDLAESFSVTMRKLKKLLNDPPYNFYLHTAPCDGKRYPFYHWHFTILPKTAIPAGFEMGTKIEISTIEPEKAAEFLRKTQI